MPKIETTLAVTRTNYPCGPCDLPLKCRSCGTIITEDNVIHEMCEDDFAVCQYCGTRKCPSCGGHVCCGGCI